MRSPPARKRFGQHFLIDRRIIADIVGHIAPKGSDRVVEIGPGRGALTEALLRCVDHLDAIEIDRDLVAWLRQAYAPARLTVHAADALVFDFSSLAPAEPASLRVVGNLPYNISTPLLFHLARFAGSMVDLHVMLQKEVVDRLAAAPGNGQYGRLSVMVQYRFAVERLLVVPRAAFRPEPAVESAIVRLTPRARAACGEPVASDEDGFAALVARAFMQRRKTLRNSLAGMIDETTLRELGVSPNCRAEELSVATYVALANRVAGARA